MALPVSYNFRNLVVRKTATIMTAVGVGCVVAVLVSVLALAEGFHHAVAKSGSHENAIFLRDGAQSEIQSAIDREAYQIVRTLPQIAVGGDGQPVISADMVIVINHPKLGRPKEETTNVTVRGVAGQPFDVHATVRIVDGRRFTPGTAEVVVGKSISRRIADCQLGGTIRQAGTDWKVVGVFEAGGSAFESEIWGDADVMLTAFSRRVFQSVTARLKDANDLAAIDETLTKDQRLKSLQVKHEDVYYAEQSKGIETLITVLGSVVTFIMFLGAIMGAMNTMYSAVSGRTREIATLLAVGFSPGSVFLSFLFESLLLCMLGGIVGCLLALPINGMATGTTNWSTFSEVAFQFRITPAILLEGVLFATFMGVVGGTLPAFRAARLRVVTALRRA